MKMTTFWDIVLCSLVGVDDVSEVHTAFIIRRLHGAISQKAFIFILAAMGT
jgi:hypothetical protein